MSSTDLYPDRPRTNEESPPLNLGGQLLVGLIFAAGVALLIVGGLYGGAIIGAIIGVSVLLKRRRAGLRF